MTLPARVKTRWSGFQRSRQPGHLGIPTQQSDLDLPLADDIRINDRGPVIAQPAT